MYEKFIFIFSFILFIFNKTCENQDYKIKRLVADYPNEDSDERIFFANSLLRNLIRTDACFLIPLKITCQKFINTVQTIMLL